VNRVSMLAREQLALNERRFYDAVKAIRRHPISGPFIVLMNTSPDLATRFAHLGHYFHARGQADESILSIRVRTFMALIGSRALNAPYEWSAWVGWAAKAGVPQATIDAVRERKPLQFLTREDTLVLDFCSQLMSGNHRVSDQVFNAAREHFGVQPLVELIGTLGYFAMIAFPLNAFEMEMTAEQKKLREPFEPLRFESAPVAASGEVPTDLSPEPSPPNRTAARVTPITQITDLPAAQQHFFDRIVRSRGHVAPPFQTLLNSPDMAERICNVGDYFNYASKLAPRLNALTWLITARALDSHYAWESAKVLADRAVLPPELIQSIARGTPTATQERDLDRVAAFCRQLLRPNHHVDDATYQAAVDACGLQAMIQVAATLGYVAMMSIITNAFELTVPQDRGELVL
jgi:4-carboxymuconolactone decarboxylase